MIIIIIINNQTGSENHEEYFTTTQRIRVVHEILQCVAFGKKKKGQIGIDRLIEDRIFTAAFPLHDVSSNQYS